MSFIAKERIPNLLASANAIFSLPVSTINTASGILVIFTILPKFKSSFALCLSICNLSLFDNESNVPFSFILSIVCIFLIDLRIVAKLVNKPPGHLSVIKGIFKAAAVSATIPLACFFVATNKIFFPDFAICFIAAVASSSIATVLLRSII